MADKTTTAPPRLWAEQNVQVPASFGLWAATSIQPDSNIPLVEYVRADLVRAAMPTNADDPEGSELYKLAKVLGMTANAELNGGGTPYA